MYKTALFALEQLTKLAEVAYNKADRSDHESVSALIRNAEGQILVLDHVKHRQFTLPIGKVEKGLSPRETLIKELGEELGIVPTKMRQVRTHKDYYMVEGKPVSVLNHLYMVDEYDGKVTNKEPEKHKSFKWLSRKELRRITNLTKTTRVALNYLSK